MSLASGKGQMSLASSERKALQQIWELGTHIEKLAQDAQFPAAELQQFFELLEALPATENLNRIRAAKAHLNSAMPVSHFQNFLLPIERLLDRHLQDDQFLVTFTDTPENLETMRAKRRPIYFILDNIRSAFNVGSMFRLADCVGASQLFLCGYTASPVDQLSQKMVVKKTSLGTDSWVDWQSGCEVEATIKTLQSTGVRVLALETGKNTISLYEKPLTGPTAFLVGNERFGIHRKHLDLCDEVRSIPMFGAKNSLNVSNALSVAAFEWSRQNS